MTDYQWNLERTNSKSCRENYPTNSRKLAISLEIITELLETPTHKTKNIGKLLEITCGFPCSFVRNLYKPKLENSATACHNIFSNFPKTLPSLSKPSLIVNPKKTSSTANKEAAHSNWHQLTSIVSSTIADVLETIDCLKCF
jgi:hypothetical protein